MKRAIVYIPLDERPCNLSYPAMLFANVEAELLCVPPELLGSKKVPANVPAIFDWVEDQAAHASAIVASADMLLYGGLLPSRIHELGKSTLDRRLDRILSLKQRHPHIRLYVHAIIMRSPAYNSSDEEPEYSAIWGKCLHAIGRYRHRGHISIITKEEEAELARLETRIPRELLEDYVQRRRRNLLYTEGLIEAALDRRIDCLLIPQDDSAEFSFSSLERLILLKEGSGSHTNIMSYPGGDELGLSLSTKAWAELRAKKTRIFPLFSHEAGLDVIPQYEGRALEESIERQFSLVNISKAPSPDLADAVIAFNLPIDRTYEAHEGWKMSAPPPSVLQLVDAMAALPTSTELHLTDIRFSNGGDGALLELLDRTGLLEGLASYSAWNTCGNSIGTTCAMAVLGLRNQELLRQRLFEDFGYMTVARQELRAEDFPFISEKNSAATARRQELGERVLTRVRELFKERFPNSPFLHQLEYKVSFPWSRPFEIALEGRGRDCSP